MPPPFLTTTRTSRNRFTSSSKNSVSTDGGSNGLLNPITNANSGKPKPPPAASTVSAPAGRPENNSSNNENYLSFNTNNLAIPDYASSSTAMIGGSGTMMHQHQRNQQQEPPVSVGERLYHQSTIEYLREDIAVLNQRLQQKQDQNDSLREENISLYKTQAIDKQRIDFLEHELHRYFGCRSSSSSSQLQQLAPPQHSYHPDQVYSNNVMISSSNSSSYIPDAVGSSMASTAAAAMNGSFYGNHPGRGIATQAYSGRTSSSGHNCINTAAMGHRNYLVLINKKVPRVRMIVNRQKMTRRS